VYRRWIVRAWMMRVGRGRARAERAGQRLPARENRAMGRDRATGMGRANSVMGARVRWPSNVSVGIAWMGFVAMKCAASRVGHVRGLGKGTTGSASPCRMGARTRNACAECATSKPCANTKMARRVRRGKIVSVGIAWPMFVVRCNVPRGRRARRARAFVRALRGSLAVTFA